MWVHLLVVFESIDFCRTPGQDEILTRDRVQNVLRRESFCLKQVRIEVDHYLTLLSAIGKGNHSPGDSNELGPQKVLAKIVQLLFGKSLTGKSQLQNRYARRAVVDD